MSGQARLAQVHNCWLSASLNRGLRSLPCQGGRLLSTITQPPSVQATVALARHSGPINASDEVALVLTSVPMAYCPSQFAQPELQATITQPPLVQATVAFGAAQWRPHWPQLSTSLERVVKTPPQNTWPFGQEEEKFDHAVPVVKLPAGVCTICP